MKAFFKRLSECLSIGLLVLAPGSCERGSCEPEQSASPSDRTQKNDRRVGILPGEKSRVARSLIQLIGNADVYDGGKAIVAGFLHIDSDGGGMLYLSKGDRDVGTFNSVNVLFDRCRMASTEREIVTKEDAEQYGEGYAIVRGTFEASREDRGPDGGTICGITSITPLRTVPSNGSTVPVQ